MSHNSLELIHSSPKWTDINIPFWLYALLKIDYKIFNTEILKVKEYKT